MNTNALPEPYAVVMRRSTVDGIAEWRKLAPQLKYPVIRPSA